MPTEAYPRDRSVLILPTDGAVPKLLPIAFTAPGFASPTRLKIEAPSIGFRREVALDAQGVARVELPFGSDYSWQAEGESKPRHFEIQAISSGKLPNAIHEAIQNKKRPEILGGGN
jgi:hypothetical protein